MSASNKNSWMEQPKGTRRHMAAKRTADSNIGGTTWPTAVGVITADAADKSFFIHQLKYFQMRITVHDLYCNRNYITCLHIITCFIFEIRILYIETLRL